MFPWKKPVVNRAKRAKQAKQAKQPQKPNMRRPTSTSGGKSEKTKKPTEYSKRIKKVLSLALNVLVTILITTAAVWLGFVGYRHITTTEYFAVDNIEVKGIQRLSEAAVLRSAGIDLGSNIFLLDLERSVELLAEHPWIVKAQIRRQLPRRLTIDVQERKAAAMVLFNVPYLVDDAGEVFKRWVLGDPLPSPVLTGATRSQYVTDKEQVKVAILDAISLANRYRASGLERSHPLMEVHREADGGFSLVVGNDPFYVRFGHGPYRTKLERLSTLIRQMRRDGDRPLMVYFDNEKRPDRVTVKLKGQKDDVNWTEKTLKTDKRQKRLSKI